jgi:hypothetical protein
MRLAKNVLVKKDERKRNESEGSGLKGDVLRLNQEDMLPEGECPVCTTAEGSL